MYFDDDDYLYEDDEFISNDPERELAIEEWEAQQAEQRDSAAQARSICEEILALARQLTPEERCLLLADIGRISLQREEESFAEEEAVVDEKRRELSWEDLAMIDPEDIPF